MTSQTLALTGTAEPEIKTTKSKPAPASAIPETENPKTEMATNTSPAPTALQSAVATLAGEAAGLRGEFQTQSARLLDLATLETQKEIILAAAENGEDFEAAASRLAGIEIKIRLTSVGIERRGNTLAGEFKALRQKMIAIKREILDALASAQRTQIEIRQGEIRAVLASWGGSAPAPDSYLAPVAATMAACNILTHLESLRSILDGWSTARPVGAFLDAARSAADYMGELNFPLVTFDESGENTLADPLIILTWMPGRSSWDVFASLPDRPTADNEFNRLQTFSAFGGVRRFVLMNARGPANTQRFANTENALTGDIASDGIHFREKGYCEPDQRFLTDGESWLSPDA